MLQVEIRNIDCMEPHCLEYSATYFILCFCEGRGAGSSGGNIGSVRLKSQDIISHSTKTTSMLYLLDLPDFKDPVSESVSGVPTEPSG